MLGLTAAEESLYEALVVRSPATLAELAGLADVAGPAGPAAEGGDMAAGRTDAVDAGLPERLRRLEQLGLVARLPEEPLRYLALPPEEALSGALEARGDELAAARRRMTQLTARLNIPETAYDPIELVEIVHGSEAALAVFERLQSGARREFRSFDGPPYLSDFRADVTDVTEFAQLRKGVRYRVVYDRQAVLLPGRIADLERSAAAGEMIRVADVPMKLALSDEPLAMLPLRSPNDLGSWLVVRGSVLYDALSALFETYWERAMPLRVAAGRAAGGEGSGLTETEHTLLALMAAGHTETEIAALRGRHPHTVNRQFNALMRRLDSRSRFQAGYQAVRRGWLTREDGSAGDA